MSSAPMPFTPTLYIKTDCPFSFKVVLFLQTAGLLEDFILAEYQQGTAEGEALKLQLAKQCGGKASFPTIEVAKGDFRSESDELIQHYAKMHGIDSKQIPIIDLYQRGLFTTYIKMVKKIKASNHGVFNLD